MKQFRKHLVKSAVAIALAVTTAVTSVAVTAPLEAQAYTRRRTTITPHYDQSEARRVLEFINNMRKSSSYAWYRDKSNKKVHIKNLRKLWWSRELEGKAMSRVREISSGKYYEKDPDGYLPKRWHYEREMINYGSPNAMDVYYTWCRNDMGFEDQKNKRAMLSHDATYIGVSCWVTSSGAKYWVAVLGAVGKKEGQGISKGKTNPKVRRGVKMETKIIDSIAIDGSSRSVSSTGGDHLGFLNRASYAVNP